MDVASAESAPATAWAQERRRLPGVSWETLEAHLFTGHPHIQLLLRVRGRVLPWRGGWYCAAAITALAAGVIAFWLGSAHPYSAWIIAGLLMGVCAGLQITGWVRAWRGYGTGADALWGAVVFTIGFLPAFGIGMLESRIWNSATDDPAPTPVFYLTLAAVALGFTGLHGSSLTPSPGTRRYQRALDAVAALPEAERERLTTDLATALRILREHRIITPTEYRAARAAPLGGLVTTLTNRSPT
ncbi:hypothetical protein [Nocardia cyriacigeorgica]|uniref:hypothetical protein n=1 Tax=Nocardia cyriacigeorgica TaxID=135487 RepID=UPI002492FB78|nr:hypothetical protein [Nocardia cyriacigeorgica]BDT87179.1 hypothetical protein FMUAM8_29430 [Nocardia cyriacigeorgica]